MEIKDAEGNIDRFRSKTTKHSCYDVPFTLQGIAWEPLQLLRRRVSRQRCFGLHKLAAAQPPKVAKGRATSGGAEANHSNNGGGNANGGRIGPGSQTTMHVCIYNAQEHRT
jgi:hypothetical protein